MLLNHGTDVPELLAQLDRLTTTTKSVIKDTDKVVLECNVGDGIQSWTVRNGSCSLPDGAVVKKGTSFNGFQEAIETLDKGVYMSPGDGEPCYVLCHASTKPVRVSRNIISNWYCLSTDGAFYVGKDLQPRFDIIELSLNDWEFSQMMQTKLAIMYEDIVYPITMSAISSVGSLMDCNSAFKRIDDCQLGSAILLTEKLAYMNKVQLVYRESSSKIRPLMAVAGGTYVHIPLNEFFRKIHDKISERHLFKAERWSITDSGAKLEMRFIPDNNLGIQVKASDLPGCAMSITAFALVGGHKVALHTNSVVHRGRLVKASLDTLYGGIEESFETFKETRDKMVSKECVFTSDLLSNILKIIGKKRMNTAKEDGHLPEGGAKMDAWELFEALVNGTHFQLPEKQAFDLMRAYKSLQDEIAGRCF